MGMKLDFCVLSPLAVKVGFEHPQDPGISWGRVKSLESRTLGVPCYLGIATHVVLCLQLVALGLWEGQGGGCGSGLALKESPWQSDSPHMVL
jgi:hypothetical protein